MVMFIHIFVQGFSSIQVMPMEYFHQVFRAHNTILCFFERLRFIYSFNKKSILEITMIKYYRTLVLQKDDYTFLLLSPGIILIIHLHTCYCLRMVMVKTTDTNVLLLFHVFQSMKKMIEHPFYCYLYKTISKNNVAYMFIVLDYIQPNIIECIYISKLF